MQIKTKKNHKTLIIAIALLLAVAFLVVGYLVIFKKPSQQPRAFINTDKPTSSEVKAGNNAKSGSNNTTANDSSSSTDSSPENTAGNSPSSTPIRSTPQISITAANQNASIVQIRTLIPAVTTAGTCTLTLRLGSSTITKTTAIQALPDSSTCKGFDIASSEFVTKGNWVAQVTYTDAIGSTQVTQNIEVR